MRHKLSSLAESGFASATGKRQLPCMAFHVALQVIAGDEPLSTESTSVRFLASVDSSVNGKMGRMGETFTTVRASIRFAVHVLLLMNP